MKINLEINEARILKLATEGMKMADVEKSIAKDIATEIKSRVKESLRDKIDDLEISVKNKFDYLFGKEAKEKLISEVKSILTPKKVKSLLKCDDWDDFLNDTVGAVLADYVSNALEEHALIDINVLCNGKKKKTVSMAGSESYTFRKN